MDAKKGYVTYEMENGETVEMSLTFEKILKLRKEDKRLYDKVNKVIVKGPEEILEIATTLYAAYICANGDGEKVMTYEGFINNMNRNYEYNIDAVKELISPSKKQDSGEYF